jgi:O-acetylhomoserine/O-acetylserine sulfhydrylase
MLRVSVGIESIEDIKRDFEQAFVAAGLRIAEKAGTDIFARGMELVNSSFMGEDSELMKVPTRFET